MAIKSVFLGHWRALEVKWLEQFHKIASEGTVAVVTAGRSQSERLMSLVECSAAGAAFFPGIPHLAQALSGTLSAREVSKPESIALAYHAGYDINSAPAAADFFEKLLENGIDADAFSVQSASINPPEKEVEKTAEFFSRYHEERNRCFPGTADTILKSEPGNPRRYSTVMIYGYYDLNPGQRNYIRMLAGSTSILWFSPVHPSHHWRGAFERTLDFLKGLYHKQDFHRVDGSHSLSPIAQFGENLLTGKALQKSDSICLKLCGSGSAFTAAVAGEVRKLIQPPWCFKEEDIAVVATGGDSAVIRRELSCCSEPVRQAAGFSERALDMPLGRVIFRLLSLPDTLYHHKDIERLLLSGRISVQDTPDSFQYSLRARQTGARFGLDSLKKTGFPFAEIISDFFSKLPQTALPKDYLGHLLSVMDKLTEASLPGIYLHSLLSQELFNSPWKIPWELFRKMVVKALEVPVTILPGSREGVRVLSPEKIRGAFYKAVILTGLEEGSFPRKTVGDPRLPVSLKKLLQMQSPENREMEEAFLLRQVFEAAEDRLIIIARHSDTKGNSVSLSPFIAGLGEDRANRTTKGGDPLSREMLSSNPSVTLSFPVNPPFLRSSLEAAMERIRFSYESPSADARHSGMIGGGFSEDLCISASMLESYARNEFNYLRERLWGLEREQPFPVTSEPDPRTRGTLVHDIVEDILATGREPAAVVEHQAGKISLSDLLGSVELAEIWKKHAITGAEALLRELHQRKWVFVEKEKYLSGSIAGYPARGWIDLIFRDSEGGLILADLKTGKPKKARAEKLLPPKGLGLFQLPFYLSLSKQNGYKPVNSTCYIHLQGTGELTFEEISAAELYTIHDQFLEEVARIAGNIRNGVFPFSVDEKWGGN